MVTHLSLTHAHARTHKHTHTHTHTHLRVDQLRDGHTSLSHSRTCTHTHAHPHNYTSFSCSLFLAVSLSLPFSVSLSHTHIHDSRSTVRWACHRCFSLSHTHVYTYTRTHFFLSGWAWCFCLVDQQEHGRQTMRQHFRGMAQTAIGRSHATVVRSLLRCHGTLASKRPTRPSTTTRLVSVYVDLNSKSKARVEGVRSEVFFLTRSCALIRHIHTREQYTNQPRCLSGSECCARATLLKHLYTQQVKHIITLNDDACFYYHSWRGSFASPQTKTTFTPPMQGLHCTHFLKHQYTSTPNNVVIALGTFPSFLTYLHIVSGVVCVVCPFADDEKLKNIHVDLAY